MDRVDATFDSQGTRCAAWLYHPEGQPPFPCVVLAHGLAATRELRLDAYATRFVQAGFAALVFDYRYFGASGGEPRQLLDIPGQLADWAAAIAYARTLEEIDTTRIALWGTSFSGGHVIVTAAHDPAIAAVIAQNPFTDGYTTIFMHRPLITLRLMAASTRDQFNQWFKKPPYYIKAIDAPGTVAALTPSDPEACRRLLIPEGVQWDNRLAARLIARIPLYRPITYAARVRCPLLVIVGKHDQITSPRAAIKTAKSSPHAELHQYDGDHFDIYAGKIFEQMVEIECEFLTRHLLTKEER